MTSLRIKRKLNFEIVHHYDSDNGDLIASNRHRFLVQANGRVHDVVLPVPARHLSAGLNRPMRRLLRTDKSSALFNHDRTGVILIYFGTIFFFDFAKERLTRTGKLRQSRSLLHCGACVTDQLIVLGEYGRNPARHAVPVWGSRNGGRSWELVHEIEAGAAKHIHGIYENPADKTIWLATGDDNTESHIFRFDRTMTSRERIGGGSQKWRMVSPIFAQGAIFWGMDSPQARCFIYRLDDGADEPQCLQQMPGPVWYTKQLDGATSLIATSVEVGPGVESEHGQIFCSHDYREWRSVYRAAKDRWPMPWFKYGVIAFADGQQHDDDFVFFGEGLSGCDGAAFVAELST